MSTFTLINGNKLHKLELFPLYKRTKRNKLLTRKIITDMVNYNVTFDEIQERIEKEQLILSVAKKLKEWSNASEKACNIFAKYSLNNLATTKSGYSMGEYIYFAFKGNNFAFANNTSSYRGKAKKYNKHITTGEIVINFKTKKQFKECINEFYKFVIQNPTANYFDWSKYIDLEQSKIKEKYIINAIKQHQVA